MRQMLVLTVLAALSLSGCGEDPKMLAQQAELAAAVGKYQVALEKATAALEDDPDNFDLHEVIFNAQHALGRYREAVEASVTAQKRFAKRVEPHEWRLKAVISRLGVVLDKSNFANNASMQQETSELIEAMKDEASWFAGHGDGARASLIRAQASIFEADKVRLMLQHAVDEDTKHRVVKEKGKAFAPSPQVAHLQTRVEHMVTQATHHLEEAFRIKPTYSEARLLYFELLRRQRDWSRVWLACNRLDDLELSAEVGAAACSALLAMPNTERTQRERTELARKVIEAVKEEEQKSSAWMLEKARLCHADGSLKEAEPLLRKLVNSAKGPMRAEARYLLAVNLISQKRNEEALAITTELAAAHEKWGKGVAIHGVALARTGAYAEARSFLRKAMELDAAAPLAREEFLKLLAEQGHFVEARHDIDEYLKIYPEYSRAFAMALQFAMASGDRDKTRELLQQIEKVTVIKPEHVKLLIRGYTYLHEYEKVHRWAQTLMNLQPESIDSHMSVARSLILLGRDYDAVKVIDKAVEVMPRLPSREALLGALFLQSGHADRALSYLQQAAKERPDDGRIGLQLASALASTGRPDLAWQQIEQILESNPGHIPTVALGVRIRMSMGDRDGVKRLLRDIGPSDVDDQVYPALHARLLLREGKTNEAIAICNRAVLAGHPDQLLRPLLAELYRMTGEPTKAEPHLLAQIHLHSDDAQAYQALATHYLKEGRASDGIRQLEKLVSLNEPLARLGQAILYQSLKNIEAGLIKLNEAFPRAISEKHPHALQLADAMASLYMSIGATDRGFVIDRALKPYEQLVASGHQKELALFRIIDLQAWADQKDAALKRLRAMAKALDAGQGRAIVETTRRLVALGEADEAVTVTRRLIEQAPKSLGLHVHFAEMLEAAGRHAETVEVYRALASQQRKAAWLWDRLASAAVKNGDVREALDAYDTMAKLPNASRRAGMRKGLLLYRLGLLEPAINELTPLIEEQRPSPRLLLTLGSACLRLNRDADAAAWFSKVPSQASTYALAQLHLAQLELQSAKQEASRARVQNVCRQAPNLFVDALAGNDVFASSRDRLVGWADEAMDTKSLRPPQAAVWERLRVDLALRERKWSVALDRVDRVAEVEADSRQVRDARVVLLIHMDKPTDARMLYEQSHRKMPSPLLEALLSTSGRGSAGSASSKSAVGMDAVWVALLRHDVKAAREAAKTVPSRPFLFGSDLVKVIETLGESFDQQGDELRRLALGWAASRSGMPTLAEELAAKVKAGSLQPLALSLRLIVASQQGDDMDALLAQAAGVKAAPSLSQFARASLLEREGSHGKAVALYESLIRNEDDAVFLRLALARCLSAAGRSADAVAELEKLYEAHHEHMPLLANNLAVELSSLGGKHRERALELARQLSEKLPNHPAVLDTVGWIEQLSGNQEQALRHLNRSLLIHAEIPVVHYHVGSAYADVNATWLAEAHLSRAAAFDDDRPGVKEAAARLATLKQP